MSTDSSLLPEHSEITAVTSNLLDSCMVSDACLVMIVGSEIGRRITLEGRELSIGRSSRSDLHLDVESVSRHHAALVPTSVGWLLRDQGSTNGTFVNDRLVREHALEDGDRIRIGQCVLKFLTGNNIEAQYHEEIYRLMTVDGLTQVSNKRYFQEALEREFARSKRYKHPFSLVLFDIDHFKQINDSYGHLAGDEVLRQIGPLVRLNVRTNDLVARVGGEEFAVLLPESDLRGALLFAEKLRRMIEGESFEHDGRAIAVSVSVGVAGFHDGLRSADALLDAADKKLYEAKRAGRNRVCG